MSLNHHSKPPLGTSINEGKGNINEENGVKLVENGSVDLDLVPGEGDKEFNS